IDLADSADLILIAPATANTIGKLASGLADNMLTATVLAARCPVWLAPAMNVNMYAHPAVRKNVQFLESCGYRLIGPTSGRLACGWTGRGRMAEPAEIAEAVADYFALLRHSPLRGKRILVTAGPTREMLDPIRFFSNRSTGRMGYAIAEAAKQVGAEVTLVSGPTELAVPHGVDLIRVTSADEMRDAVIGRFDRTDAVIKAAAVADYRPETFSATKLKKSDAPLELRLVRNPDILKELGEKKKGQLLVGFAAETDRLKENAARKLAEKHLDLLVANRAADGFAGDTNRVVFFFRDGRSKAYERMPKRKVAEKICATLAELMKTSEPK
ncbi:MAG: bifunctional phosphopantothenoylcysteine decarboxylase/phosphopantothenate--cysteine ligase CoaBC, partial [Sporolactobacillus sp.]|nr:bifunctional phosphopantothenoylcysteine decarboxylase/phosphopantothenate--cysteine ligase CoaBC [Sporolactobacillus sp.]